MGQDSRAQAAKCGRGAVARGNEDSRWLSVLGVALTGASGTGPADGLSARLTAAAAVPGILGAFGPGEMVAGIAAIGALAGSGAAVMGADEGAWLAGIVEKTLWRQPVDVVRSSLATVLGVLEAQRLLGLEVGLATADGVLSESLARATSELEVHKKLGSEGPARAGLQAKVALFDKALDWIRDPDRKWTSARVVAGFDA